MENIGTNVLNPTFIIGLLQSQHPYPPGTSRNVPLWWQESWRRYPFALVQSEVPSVGRDLCWHSVQELRLNVLTHSRSRCRQSREEEEGAVPTLSSPASTHSVPSRWKRVAPFLEKKLENLRSTFDVSGLLSRLLFVGNMAWKRELVWELGCRLRVTSHNWRSSRNLMVLSNVLLVSQFNVETQPAFLPQPRQMPKQELKTSMARLMILLLISSVVYLSIIQVQ
jgi:hypothetical protein